jgi:hypothetical protein
VYQPYKALLFKPHVIFISHTCGVKFIVLTPPLSPLLSPRDGVELLKMTISTLRSRLVYPRLAAYGDGVLFR